MTIADIRAALNAELDTQAGTFGENDSLSPIDNTYITDRCAATLETVNPNNDYPPTPK